MCLASMVSLLLVWSALNTLMEPSLMGTSVGFWPGRISTPRKLACLNVSQNTLLWRFFIDAAESALDVGSG